MPELPKTPSVEIDRENAFLLYATFCGDVVRTAHAIGVVPQVIIDAARDGGWNDKLADILSLKKSTRPGDVERGMNRALNFVQAHQLRLFVSRVIHSLTGMSEADFKDYIYVVSTTKDGGTTENRKLTTRAIADLASAMEKCQSMSYLALNDSSAERMKRKEISLDDDNVSAGDMHARIAAAMSCVSADKTPKGRLLDAQLVEASRLKRAIAE